MALAMTEQAAERIVAAVNAVQKLPTAALTAGVIAMSLLTAFWPCTTFA